MKKRCHLNWIARNIVDKPIQRPIRLEISKIRIFEVQNVRWLKLSRHKPDIKQTFSREIEQNYSFLFDIIWNDKLRVSRTSFKFESNIIESRIYHVIYPKKSHDESHDLPPLTWSILKIKLVCKKFFLEQYLKWRCWINQALQN